MYKAIIFDLDGLLIDSMPHWDKSSTELLGKRGVKLTPELTNHLTGRSLRENMEWLKEKFNWADSVDDLVNEFRDATDHIYYNLTRPMPGASNLLAALRPKGLKQAIASGSFLYRIQKIVDRFSWHKYFDKLISSDHVNFAGKPDPAIYLYAAEALEADPSECLVFEDSPNGVRSAKAAGMSCIAVSDRQKHHQDIFLADALVATLEDEKILPLIF